MLRVCLAASVLRETRLQSNPIITSTEGLRLLQLITKVFFAVTEHIARRIVTRSLL
jgi:hypothetical protein